ncbi:sulfite exporter TauE/SafE family protein [Amaricoccus macauensis]|uniref:sulfite exporter TauE/SafE family protein n=1 Tax=Amaricoccus macauensis TaxID=57001 RepID=UPI003C7A7BA9
MPDPAQLLPFLGLLFVIGAFAGVVAGLLGVGGGIVLVPAFLYTFIGMGYDGPLVMQVCLATSLATIIVTSARSLSSHNRKGAVRWDILKSWAPGIAVGALFGVVIARGLKTESLMITFGILGTLVGLYIGFGRDDWRLGTEMPGRVGRSITSAVVGFISVLMGIGGGSFGVPIMRLFGVPIHNAVATASGFGLSIALPSVLGFLLTGHGAEGLPPFTLGLVNLPAFLVVISATIFTAPLGAKLAHAMNPKPLKRTFAVFIVITALNMLRQAVF